MSLLITEGWMVRDEILSVVSVAFAFSPDGLLLATATSEGSVALRDVSDPAAQCS